MIRQFIRHSLLYALSTLFVRGLGFLLLPLYTRALSIESYGKFDYVIAIGSIVGVSVAFEVTQAVHRFTPDLAASRMKQKYYISTALWFTCLCYGALIFSAFLLAPTLAGWIFGTPSDAFLVKIAVLLFFANACVYFITIILRSTLRSGHSTLISAFYALCCGGFSLLFLLGLRGGLQGLLIGQLIGSATTAIVGLLLIRNHLIFGVSKSALKKLLKYSAPLVPSSIGIMLALFVDRLMVKEMLGFESLGIYGVAIRVAAILSLLSVGFQYAITPLIYSKHTDPATPANIAKLYHYYLFISALLFTAVSLSSGAIASFLTDEGAAGAASLIPILAAAVVFSSMHVFFPGLSIALKTGIISAINIAAGVLNIGLNYLLISYLGEAGAAYATLFSAVAAWLGIGLVAQRYYSIPVSIVGVAGYLFFIGMFLMFNEGRF